MAHYGQGDNYGQGDYYGTGDFLGLGKAFKSFARGALRVGAAAFEATPVGRFAKAFIHPSLPPPKGVALQTFAGGGPMIQPPSQFGLINLGGTGSQSGLINVAGAGPDGRGPTMKGYHLNKSTYETRGGGTSRWGGAGNLQLHVKGTTLVRNRRMNVGNARALKRSLRRVGGFARLARRVMTFTHPRAGRGHFKFKKRARR